MNFQMKNKSLGIMFLAICALSFVLGANAQADINAFCANTEKPQSKPYCMKVIAGATSWEQASTWAVNRLMRLMSRGVEPTLKSIEAKLVPSIAPEKKIELVNKCRSSYKDVVDGLLEIKKLIKRDPSGAYMNQVAVTSIVFNDCRESIIDQNGQPEIAELNKFNAHILKILDVAISLANADPRLKAPLASSYLSV